MCVCVCVCVCVISDQRLKLGCSNPDDEELIRGQLICECYHVTIATVTVTLCVCVVSLTSRDHSQPAPISAILPPQPNELPEG